MKILITGFLAVCCCVAFVNCQQPRISYAGFDQGKNLHIYLYDGQNYPVSLRLHELFRLNPDQARDRFLTLVREKNSSRFGASNLNAEPEQISNEQQQRQEETEAQKINLFNKAKNPTAVTFPGTYEKPSLLPSFVPPQRPQIFNQRPQSVDQSVQNQPNFNPSPQGFNSNSQSFSSNPQSFSSNPQSFNTNPQKNNQFPPNNSPFPDFPQTQSTGFNVPIPQRETQDRGNRAITEFAWRLFKGSNSQSDYVLSPLSPQILLSYLAWVAEGRTREELVLANGYGNPKQIQRTVDGLLRDGSKRELQIATAFFVSKDMRLNQEFLDKSVESADVVNVDFKNPEVAGRTITKWAKMKTKGGLELNAINYAPSTKIALTSAVYFKANWIFRFPSVKPGVFYSQNGPVQVDMMNLKKKFRWGKVGEFAEWTAIPYESEDSLIIILPNKGQSLDNVINIMTEQTLTDVLFEFDRDSSNADVNITMPKFKLESTTSLVEPLKKMGIQTLFSPRAELPYLSDYDSVQVSNAEQQSSIDVNEEGTIATSFTNINVVALSFSPAVPSVDFVVDRPFIAVIANRNRNIPYVIAKITNPKY